MASFNLDEAKTHFSRLLDLVLQGETVSSELVLARKRAFPLGEGRNDPNLDLAALESDDRWRR